MSFRRTAPVILAFLLLVLPFIVFSRDLQKRTARTNEEIRRSWVRNTTDLAKQFEEMCQPNFWVRESARSLRTALQRSQGRERAAVVNILSGNIRSHLHPGIVAPRVYAYFHEGDAQGSSGDLLTGPGFQSSYKFLFSRLLAHLGQAVNGSEQSISRSGEAIRQITGILGESLPAGVFHPDSRGLCFPVFFERKFRLAVWDTVVKDGKPFVTFLLLFPNGPHAYADSIRLALREFPRIAPDSPLYPVVIPLRTPGAKRGWSIRSSRPGIPKQVVSLCRTVRGEMVVRPPRKDRPGSGDHAPPTSGGFPGNSSPNGQLRIWDVSLPAHRMIAPAEQDGWWGLLAPLHPFTTAVAVFVGPAPSEFLETVDYSRAFLVVGLVLCFLWGAVAATGRKPPFIGIRSLLMLWVLGLALTPICTIWGSSDRMFNAFRLNQLQFLESELQGKLEAIENRFTMKRNEWLSTCRGFLTDPLLTRDFNPLQIQDPRNRTILESLQQSFVKKGIHPHLIMISTSSKDNLSWFNPTLSTGDRTGLRDLFKLILDELCLSLALRKQTLMASDTAHFTNLGKNECLTKSDSIYESQLGARRTLSYFNFFRTEKGDEGVILILWSEESRFAEFLREDFKQLSGDASGDSIAAFKIIPEPTLICSTGDPAIIERIAGQVRTNRFGMNPQDGMQRRALLFSTRLPGYLFVASRSMRQILLEIQIERERIASMILLLLVMGVLGAALLGSRIHDPIVAMTHGLQRISQGDLRATLSEERHDETGTAGRHLNQMTVWLKERLNLSRFVSSDVMATVAKGNPENLFKANRRNAVILVTDIRGFTTLSETYPPDQIFKMINRHLQGMTRVIRSYHGTIDRFIGDAIQVVFTDDELKDPSTSAVCAALAMMQEHQRIIAGRQAEGLFSYAIGIGIERGDIVSGVLGDPSVRLDFTILGDALREAAELEAASKNGVHSRIVCSSRIRHDLADAFEFTPVTGHSSDDAWEVVEPELVLSPESLTKPSEASPNQSLPKSPDPGRSEPVDEGQAAGFDWRGPGSILAGLLVILFLALGGIESIDRSVNKTLGKQLRLEIQKEFSILERINDPRFQISQCIQRRIDSAIATWSAEALEAALPTALADIGSPAWAILHLGQGLPESLDIPAIMLKTRMKSGETSFPLTEGPTKTIYWRILRRFAPGTLPSNAITWLNSQNLNNVRDGHQILGFDEVDRTAYRSPVPVRIDGRDYLLLWTSDLSLTPHRSSLPVAMILLPAESFTSESGHRAFIENQTGPDTSVALVPLSETGPGSYVSGVFASRPEFRDLLDKDVPEQIIESRGERWQVHSNILVREKLFRLFMARRTPTTSFRADEWKGGAFALFGLAGICFAFLFLRSWHLQIPMKLGLRGQMVGVLLLMVIPLIMQGVVFLERAGLEETVLRANQKSEESINQLHTIEHSKALYGAYHYGLFDSFLNNPAVIGRLMKFESAKEEGRQESISRLLRQIQRSIVTRGGAIGNCILGGSSFVVARKHGGEISRNELLRARIFHAPHAKILQQVAQDSGSTAHSKDLLVTLGEVTVSEVANPVASPITLAEIWLGRQALYSLVFSGKSDVSIDLRMFLFYDGVPRFSFKGQLDYPANRHRPLADWHRWLLSNQGAPNLFSIRKQLPTIGLNAPFCEYLRTGEGFEYAEVFSFLHPEISRMVMEAFTSGSPHSAVVEFQGRRNLVSVAPEKSGDSFALALVSDLGVMESSIRFETATKRWLMAAMIIFCILAARLISTFFLSPLLALTRATQAVRDGNLDLRLDENEPGEFQLLAASFNHMADGVREGSLLSRFVSDSVRDAARTRTTIDGGDRGEHQRLTVLFAGLSNFKSLLADVPPEHLFSDLNLYLEAMSGVIRHHDGDIDKFIGDKILAVFRDTPSSSQTSMEHAVAAAIAMKQRFKDIEDTVHSSLGIGIVTGPVIAGILGTAEVRLEYTVLGDTVNLASRLSDLAQKLDKAGGIYIEAETRNAIDNLIRSQRLTVRRLDLPPIKGKTRSVQGFAIE